MAAATRSTASLCMLRSGCAYRVSVIAGDEWPSIAWTSLGLAWFCNARVAAVRRRTWNPLAPTTPARVNAFTSRRASVEYHARPPDPDAHSGASDGRSANNGARASMTALGTATARRAAVLSDTLFEDGRDAGGEHGGGARPNDRSVQGEAAMREEWVRLPAPVVSAGRAGDSPGPCCPCRVVGDEPGRGWRGDRGKWVPEPGVGVPDSKRGSVGRTVVG